MSSLPSDKHQSRDRYGPLWFSFNFVFRLLVLTSRRESAALFKLAQRVHAKVLNKYGPRDGRCRRLVRRWWATLVLERVELWLGQNCAFDLRRVATTSRCVLANWLQQGSSYQRIANDFWVRGALDVKFFTLRMLTVAMTGKLPSYVPGIIHAVYVICVN